jgi:hypothetical protein
VPHSSRFCLSGSFSLGAPTPVSDRQLKELGIAVVGKKDM